MQKSTQAEKARIGAIGENNVVSKLMQHDWDAFNANCTIKNFKSIDIVCLNSGKCVESKPWMPSVALVQVKTSVQTNIPAGFTIGQCLDRQYLEQNVKGAYVFVAATKINEHDYSFRYFIISRQDFIELIYQAHQFYVYGYTRVAGAKPLQDENRENGINLQAPAGLYVRWLEGASDKATVNHIAFNNPLNGVSCEDKWDNIWKD
jgi:hypothetical protein